MSSFVINGVKTKRWNNPTRCKKWSIANFKRSVINSEKITVHNIPNIIDVVKLIDLIESIGVIVEKLSESSYTFQAQKVNFEYLKSEEYREKSTSLRGSIMMIGPLLARFGKGYIPKPGGDKIGRRRVDTHFTGFQN